MGILGRADLGTGSVDAATRSVTTARPVRGHARREPLHGDGRDQGRRPGGRGVVAALTEVTLTTEQPAESGLSAPMQVADRTLWLGVSGRDRTEPFDDADRALLEALASVGAVALANAELYGEVQQEKDKLSVITSSLGEGVCAVSEAGEITFMNPAGASMLGWYGVETGDEGPVVPAERDAGLPAASRPCGPSRCGATSPATTPASSGSTGRTSR